MTGTPSVSTQPRIADLKGLATIFEQLRESLRAYAPAAANEQLHQRAEQRCLAGLLGANIEAVDGLLRSAGMMGVSQAAALLRAKVIPLAAEVGAEASSRVLNLVMDVAWMLADQREAVTLIEGARGLASGDGEGTLLSGVKMAIRARGHQKEGDLPRAIAASRVVLETEGLPPSLKAPALEVLAAAFDGLHDAGHAKEVLGHWSGLYGKVPGGAVGEAMRFSLANDSAAAAAERSAQMLSCASRYAQLLHEQGDVEPARRVLEQFLAAGLHEWRDPARPFLGTIAERLRRLARGQTTEDDGSPAEIVLHRVARQYGRIPSEGLVELLTAFVNAPSGSRQVVLIRPEKVYNNRFGRPHQPEKAEIIVCAAFKEEAAGLCPDLGMVAEPVWAIEMDGKKGRLILVTHAVEADELAGVGFTVLVTVVGTEMQVTVHGAVVGNREERTLLLQQARKLAAGEEGELPGYGTLRDRFIEVLQRACMRAANGEVAT